MIDDWERDASACNVDVMTGLGRVGRLVDHREPASAHPRCTSAFGVHDMAGNVDEWVTIEGMPVEIAIVGLPFACGRRGAIAN